MNVSKEQGQSQALYNTEPLRLALSKEKLLAVDVLQHCSQSKQCPKSRTAVKPCMLEQQMGPV